jgi:hypothetical protein
MIKANELRIGNWVINSGELMAITVVHPITKAHEHFEPIKISPEILTQWCGFKKIGKYYSNMFLLSDGVDKDRGFYIWTDYSKRFLEQRVSVKYLHQLQNLFFALTGSELEIKIPGKG